MSHRYQPHSSSHDSFQGLTPSNHWPLSREPVHRPIPLQKLPSITHYALQGDLPDIQNHASHNRALSRRSGLVILQNESRPVDFSDDESRQPVWQDPNALSGLKPRSATVWSRCIMYLHLFIINYIIDWWLIEILSWCFSASCMAAVFGVLVYHNNRVLPVWPLGITLNGFISLLSVCAKAALLLPTAEGLGQLKWSHFRKDSRTMMDIERIDLASRGPWGAILLLARTRAV
jgi:hypothetical protein